MAQLFLKYGVSINKEDFSTNIKRIINQLYKILPMREEGKDWKKPLQTLIEQLCGMKRLLLFNQDSLFFTIICKMEGLFDLVDDKEDMSLYRRTIFECLGLLNSLNKNVLEY